MTLAEFINNEKTLENLVYHEYIEEEEDINVYPIWRESLIVQKVMFKENDKEISQKKKDKILIVNPLWLSKEISHVLVNMLMRSKQLLYNHVL